MGIFDRGRQDNGHSQAVHPLEFAEAADPAAVAEAVGGVCVQLDTLELSRRGRAEEGGAGGWKTSETSNM